ncbi:reverse transcriptase domain-containing protein [Rhodoferax sp.]|uniref:reverse transcriptase domain-containing protein n=1 Tax=Rhodoferax sp. TaxID=50421 RepID=UPI002ACE014E|nr:reverse transcriptase domain-containing protein [Rhodoferax sp.]MDZ7918522.1 reverse transcriptase domain-containing protein [Rhodoferax sp.]
MNSNWNISLRAAGGNCLIAGAHHGTLVSLPYLLRQIHLGVWGTVSSENRKPRQHFSMGKKHKNLFTQITAMDNLRSAYRKAAKGKRNTKSHLEFAHDLDANLSRLGEEISAGAYRQGTPRTFFVHEPKLREITAMPFVDRVAQHALCNVIEPIIDKVFLPQSFACRKGRGTHSAAREVQAELRRMEAKGVKPWVLKTDFSKYFYSIQREVLHTEYRRKIACPPTRRLLEAMIPVAGVGIPIGNLTSQLSANLYGHVVDRWLAHDKGITKFYRYMDDIIVLGDCHESLRQLQQAMQSFALDVLGLRFSRWSIQPASRGINFVGYRIWATYKLLRRDSVLRAKRKIKRYTKRGEMGRLRMFLASWKGHAQWADSKNLLAKLGVAA